jgi:glutamine---fructose-6-phosphate transaminase (isomerizing)
MHGRTNDDRNAAERSMPITSVAPMMVDEAASAHSAILHQLRDNGPSLRRLQNSFLKTPPAMVIVSARGSSSHAATYLRYVLETQSGMLTTSLAPSICSVYDRSPSVADSICIVLSQSGRSPDLLAVVENMNRIGVRTVALINETNSPLAAKCRFVVPLQAGAERSIPATKSFIASLFAGLRLARCIDPLVVSDEDLASVPDLLQRAWVLDWTPLVDSLIDAQGLYVIGRGAGLAIASEAALKFKETCNLHAEAFSAAEVRHGPMALFDNGFPILIFRQNDAGASSCDDLATLAVEHGCRVFVVGGMTPGSTSLATIGASPLLEPMAQIQTFYKAVSALSLKRGHDPDRPPALRKVTLTL